MKIKLASLAAASALALTAGAAHADDEFTIQLKWVTQAQFAGYYVAEELGFYDDLGLDVTILPGGPDIAPPQVLAAGGADILVEWMPAALAARERGLPLVNVAQIFNRSGMMLTCREDTGIATPADFPGKTLGVWFFGNEYPFLSWMSELGIPTEGGDDGVTVLRQGFNVDPLLQGQADCVSTMIYNEYWQVVNGGIPEDELVTFFYEDQGVATLEDGLYVVEENLEDMAFVDRLIRFIAGSIQGWEYARANPEEAAEIVQDYETTGVRTYEDQLLQMEWINSLITSDMVGFLEPAAFDRTVGVLLGGDSDPVITENPGAAAWTHAIYEAAVDHMGE